MNADGSDQSNLTNHPQADQTPDWSPDGAKIVFPSRRPGNFEIYVMDANGANPTRMTFDTAVDAAPHWQGLPPDGDWDGDGCSNAREAGLDPRMGGARDPNNPWDFYDVGGAEGGPPDRYVDLANDILPVILHYSPEGSAPYDGAFDRGPSKGANPWNMTAPDGVIDLANDILGVIQQYQHDCR
jgi:hypothetical protein